MQDTSSTQVVIPNYLVILSHQCKLHHQLSWYYQITLLYFPTNASYIINSGGNTKLPCYTPTNASYIINLGGNTKLPCYTLWLTQHYSFFRNIPPLFPEKWIKPVDKLYVGDVISSVESQSKR